MDWGQVVRQAVIPVASAYAVFLVILLMYHRQRAGARREPTRPERPEPTWRDLLRYLLTTALGGYAVFLAIVAVFYLILGGQSPRLLREALVEGSALAFGIVVPAFLAISWLHERRR